MFYILTILLMLSSVQAKDRSEAIKKHIYAKKTDFSNCYDQLLEKKLQNSEGQVVLQINIGMNGDVILVQIDEAQTTLKEMYFWGCLVDTARQWKFPKGQEGEIIRVSYPLVFETQKIKTNKPKSLNFNPAKTPVKPKN